MAYDINIALERLEKNLKDLNSAKEQVKNTVNTSMQLQGVVNSYVASVNSVLQETIHLKEEVMNLKNQKIAEMKEAVKLIGTSCTDIIASFKSGTKETLQSFDTENNKLAKTIADLQSFQAKLERFIEISSSVDAKLEQTSKSVLSLQEKQDEGFTKTSEQVNEVNTLLEKVESLNKDIQLKSNQIDKTTTMTYSAVEDLTKQVAEQHETIRKNININRWILIAGIIILAICSLL